ncbi:transcription factor 21 [Plakobranchus ocellatus]|uniref:Transcription factor 21 n=1 Tax=Plakobranchus ocellatus TaxID=259542 RepID=A0AAV4D6W2_9GAST|nr:transcription factor 21 [Plakobranchus ocellatus]
MPRRRKEDVERDLASGKTHKPQQRNAANARERSRMRILSKAFSRLKTTLPWVPPDTKLSKLDTLRLASSYIAHLKQILDHEETLQAAGFIHPLNLTWPFTFNGRTFGSTHASSPLGQHSSSLGTRDNNSSNNSNVNNTMNNNTSNVNHTMNGKNIHNHDDSSSSIVSDSPQSEFTFMSHHGCSPL